jgi:hypothetical protein
MLDIIEGNAVGFKVYRILVNPKARVKDVIGFVITFHIDCVLGGGVQENHNTTAE